MPFIATAGELKTKPTQHSVKELLSIGIQPDLLICRSDRQLGADLKAKIALFCNMNESCVISAPDVGNIYEVPMSLASEGLDEQILRLLHLEAPPRDLSRWLAMLEVLEHPQGEVRIGVVGKYVQLEDAYKSLREALVHGGLANRHRVSIEWIEAEEVDSTAAAERLLRHVDGILIPGGFGKRGIQGMVHAITYAREKKIPFFGICLGMQCATIEYARQVSNLDRADSTEFDPGTPNRVIYKLRELLGVDEMGGTMRLGAWACKLEPGSFAAQAYGTTEISERHRHRYEFNCEYEKTLTGAGFRITGRTPDGVYVEIVEVPDHPWFVGCQFHPEFKSKPLAPHPLFAAFIRASVEHRHQRQGQRRTSPAFQQAVPRLASPALRLPLRISLLDLFRQDIEKKLSPCRIGVPSWSKAAAQLAGAPVSQPEGDPADAGLCGPRLEGRLMAMAHHPGPAAIHHQLAELLTLRRRDRVSHVQPLVDCGFLQGQLRGANFLKLAVDGGAVWLIGGKQILQIDSLHLHIGPIANRSLAEI